MKQFMLKVDQGFTLVELLVSAIISIVILSISLSLINTQRAQFLRDQTRSQANQNLRAAIDLIGTDIKLAGERLDEDTSLPVIQLLNGNGTDGDPNEYDRLILQRKIISDVLRTCETVDSGDTTIVIATESNLPTPGSNCGFSDIDNGNTTNFLEIKDALTDNLNEFRNYRCDAGSSTNCDRSTVPASAVACDEECTIGIIVNPVNGDNELFYYTYEECIDGNSGDDCQDQRDGDNNLEIKNVIHAIPLEGTSWTRSYAAGAEIFLFEEREYSFDDVTGILELTMNREDQWNEVNATTNNGAPLQLVNQILDFDLQVLIEGDTNFVDAVPNTIDDWTEIRSVRVDLESSNPSDSDLIDLPRGGCANDADANRLCLSTDFFPRNALNQ